MIRHCLPPFRHYDFAYLHSNGTAWVSFLIQHTLNFMLFAVTSHLRVSRTARV